MSSWIGQMFDAKQAQLGGVVRRDIEDVEHYASMAELMDEVERRNFHAVKIGQQVIVICNTGQMQVLR